MTLGERIRARRKELGYSLQQVADMSACSKAHIWDLERNNSDNPGIKLLHNIAYALDVTLKYLVDINETSERATDAAFYQNYLTLPENLKSRIRRVVREMLR